MRTPLCFGLWLGLAAAQPLAAQLPASAAYELLFDNLQNNAPQLRQIRYLSAGMEGQYVNQPAYIADWLYLSVQPKGEAQTDIFSYQSASGRYRRRTRSSQSEYSPSPTPDGQAFTVVRVETDGRQRLWRLPLDHAHEGQPLFPDLGNIGYHAWLSEDEVALFLVDEPHRLVIGDLKAGSTRFITSHIGRCLRADAQGRLWYVKKNSATRWVLCRLDADRLFSTEIITTLDGSEDFELLPDGSVLMAKGSALYRFRPGQDAFWVPIAELGWAGIAAISRLAYAQGRLAIIAGR